MQPDGKSREALDLFGFGKIVGHATTVLLRLIRLWETRYTRKTDAIKGFELLKQTRELHSMTMQRLAIDNEGKVIETERQRIENEARLMEIRQKEQRHQLEIRSFTSDVERKERENARLPLIDIVVDIGPAALGTTEGDGTKHISSKQVSGTTKPSRPRKISARNTIGIESPNPRRKSKG